MKPDWILIASAKRARVLQQEAGASMELIESFVHPAGRGVPEQPLLDARQKDYTQFAHELAQYLEMEARQGHFGSLAIFACPPFVDDLLAGLGRVTAELLSGVHERDLTSVGVAELERRVSREMAVAH